jgi:hypothetical protein
MIFQLRPKKDRTILHRWSLILEDFGFLTLSGLRAKRHDLGLEGWL